MVIADRSLEASRTLAAALPDGRAESDRIDASKVESMVDAFKDDDRRAAPPSEVLRVTDPHAADRGERRIRSDDRYPGTAASGGSVFNGSVEGPGEITLPC